MCVFVGGYFRQAGRGRLPVELRFQQRPAVGEEAPSGCPREGSSRQRSSKRKDPIKFHKKIIRPTYSLKEMFLIRILLI